MKFLHTNQPGQNYYRQISKTIFHTAVFLNKEKEFGKIEKQSAQTAFLLYYYIYVKQL